MNPLRQLFTRRRRYTDLSASIHEHLEEQTEELMQEGLTRREAERRARRAFGNIVRIEQQSREIWQWPTLESLFADLRYAARQLRKSPAFTASAILILALGIGANTTVFSVVDAVMLRPLPYAQPEKLVEIQSSEGTNSDQHFESGDVSYPDFFDWRTKSHSFDHLFSSHDTSLTLTGIAQPRNLDGQVVSWEMLPTLGVTPELGRGFTPDDEKQGAHLLLISHNLWKTQFAANPTILGRALRLDGTPYTVIGVMPATFRFPVNQPVTAFWTTLAADIDPTASDRPITANRGVHFLTVFGRLKTSASTAQADQEMKTLASNLARQYPDSNTRHNSALVESLLTSILGDTRPLLLIVLGAVTLVLFIACSNIANLLLARVRDRYREIAMRSALGASRARIIRQLLAESLLLGLAGGLTGCLLAFLATPAVLHLIGDSVPRAADAGLGLHNLDLPVLAFALAASLVSSLLFGIIPAITASKTDLIATLKTGGYSNISSHDRLRSAVIVGQVALGIVLTTGAGLLITSFVKLTQMDKGFNPTHLLTFTFDLPDATYKQTRPEFYRNYFEKLRTLPGVTSVGGGHNMPMTSDLAMLSFENPLHPLPSGQQPNADFTFISPDYFRTLQTPLLEGRGFTLADNMKSPQVIIINQAFARQFFPGVDPIGKKIKPGASNGAPGGPPMREIVGVVGNIRHFGTQIEMPPAVYVPEAQLPNWCCLRTVLRTTVDPRSLEPTIRRLVTSMDPNLPVTEVRTMDDLLSLQLAQPRFAMIFLGAFAALALLLTLVGLYGVITYSVSRRTREIGVRLALGAQRSTILKMTLRDAAILLLTGTAIGLPASIASATLLKSALYGANPQNPLILAAVCLTVALTGLLAAGIPSLRAASINPTEALRTE